MPRNGIDLALLLFVIFFILLFSYLFTHELVCTETKVIQSVGGCNRYTCGVTYTDGSFGTQEVPSVGKTVCFHSEFQKR